jgi:tetratricopeptide (TPR) repeat protein
MKTVTYLTLAATLMFAAPALAAGESSSPGTNTPKTSLHCKKGEVIKKVKKNGSMVDTCVKVSSGILPDEDLYQQGRQLAKDGYYDWALEVLAAIQNQNDPRVLNYTGYSNRKAGRLELGISYYHKALAINPDFVLAREYLGEGYVAAGRIDLAKNELQEIQNRCGTTCEEYKDLQEAITTSVN